MLACGFMFRLQDIYFRYRGKPVLAGVNLSLRLGDALLLEGENGAGKTTLLRLMAGVLLPERGAMEWEGRPFCAGEVRVGYVPVQPGFYPRLRVWENLAYFGSLYGFRESETLSRARAADPFGIDYWELPLEACSSGMKQKLNWVRALMISPKLLLLDEAFNGLDTEAEQSALRVLAHGERIAVLAQHGKDFPLARARLVKGKLS